LLHLVKVFIAEDEPFIALPLALAVDSARGKTIGPAGSVAEAKALLDETEPDIALLDVHLSDGEISSIARSLADRSIPIIFHCADLPFHLKRGHPDAPVCIKPVTPDAIIGQIAILLGRLGGTDS
jgi:two-component SAPR family response regulator